MPGLDQIEEIIRALPAKDFMRLAEWMCDRHLEVIISEGFESPELESELLAGLSGPRHEVNEAFYDGIRSGWKDSSAD